jgi:hypothetical protein
MKRPTRWAAPLALLCVMLSSQGASAELLRLSLGGSDTLVSDPSYNYVSDDNFLSLGQLGLDFKVAQGDWGGLWVGGEYQWAQETGGPLSGASSVLDLDGGTLRVRYEYEPLSFLGVWAGAGAGVQHINLRLNLAEQDREQALYAWNAEGLVGVDVHIPKGLLGRLFGGSRRGAASEWTVGVSLEGGYRASLDAEFDNLALPEPEKEPDPEDRDIPTDPLSFGTLNLSGAVMRASLYVRF